MIPSLILMVMIMNWTNNDNTDKDETVNATFEETRKKIREQIKTRMNRDRTYHCCSITGDPKVGKTGVALDSRTDEEIERGMKVYVLDFDDGAEPTWSSSWDRDENIIIFNPLEYFLDGTLNWEVSMQNGHDFCRYVKDVMAEGEEVKSVIFDGLDKALECASDILRNHLVKSLKRSGTIIHETDSIRVPPLDWKIRNRINERLLTDFLTIECDRYLITHMKPVYEGIHNPSAVGEVPNWEKSTPAKFHQMIHITKTKVGSVTNYVAKLTASKTNSDLVGKEWTIFTTNGDNKWFGIPELREGKL